nr:RNA-directed DNA polymerase, eukaryota, reverse transcriptase zinc-binding domain protein [Tanacetum cinerariifolium]
WNESNIETIVHVLECFHRASRLRINMSKSKLMGIYADAYKVDQAARKICCVTLKTPFTYLGSKVGGISNSVLERDGGGDDYSVIKLEDKDVVNRR